MENNMSKRHKVLFPLIFAIVAVVGLFYVKWDPYYAKAFVAAAKGSIGSSIITGTSAQAPEPSVQAALDYASAYFTAVWKAVVLGLLVGSLVQVLIPRKWVTRFMGANDFASSLRSGAAALPGMMCTCCAAPVTEGLRARSASVRSAVTFFLANPVLNPATIVFMGFVLSWEYAAFRIVAGIITVFCVSWLAGKAAGEEAVVSEKDLALKDKEDAMESFMLRWMKSLWKLILHTIPAYLIVVLALGFARAWLFPTVGSEWGNDIFVIIGLALAGTLFVIPTAAEIPVVQTLLAVGLSTGPAVTLMMTLPAVSLPSLLIVKKAFPAKALFTVFFGVVIIGIICGLIAPYVLG